MYVAWNVNEALTVSITYLVITMKYDANAGIDHKYSTGKIYDVACGIRAVIDIFVPTKRVVY